jgi:hypothetical protein
MIQVHPEFHDDRLLRLFEKGIHGQWGEDAIAWGDADRVTAAVRHGLALTLTPVYLGEQTAMLGIATVIPMLLRHGEAEAVMYLSSMQLDEARHFRNLHRLYDLFQEEPLAARRLPEMWRYHARLLQSRDPLDWVWGILISDLFARRFYGAIRDIDPNGLLGALSRRTLQDEARHQAFSDRFLENRIPELPVERRQQLVELRDDLFRVMDALSTRLAPAARDAGIDSPALLDGLWADTERWVHRLDITGDRRPVRPTAADAPARRHARAPKAVP